MPTIDGRSYASIRFMREKPAALAVFWIYVSRCNYENVSWPSLRGLVYATGWSINVCGDARKWLVEHEALEEIKDYVRPHWRKLPENEKRKRLGMDKSEYYRPTGYLLVEGKKYPLLYDPSRAPRKRKPDVTPDETSTPASVPDVSPEDTSSAEMSHAIEHVQGDTELNTSLQLGTNSSELDTSSNSGAAADDFNIFNLYHETFGKLVSNGILADDLKDIASTYQPNDIRDAFKETARANASSINYTVAILQRWQREGRGKPAPSKTRPAPKPTESPDETRLKTLKAEILAALSDTPPDTYLPDRTPEDRQKSWRLAGRIGTAKRLAQERLEQEKQPA